jgi:hypothetical protein
MGREDGIAVVDDGRGNVRAIVDGFRRIGM